MAAIDYPKERRRHSGTRTRRCALDGSFGRSAPKEARLLGRADRGPGRVRLGRPRREAARCAGGDDYGLELARLGVSACRFGVEFRLVDAQADKLTLGWIRTATEELLDVVGLPSTAIAEIESSALAWASLREDVGGGLFVDYRRSLAVA